MTLTIECGGREITTIEGLAGAADETLHPVQESFMDHSAFQCGFCTPGIIMSATALLDENPAPQREQVTEAPVRPLLPLHQPLPGGGGGAGRGRPEREPLMPAPYYRHIGKPTRRKDAREIVTGRAEYIDDLKMSDLLHAKVLRSPHAHAKIVSIDAGRAEALPGVAMVLTHHNAPDWKLGAPRDFTMLSAKVRFPGDAVAVVAAETPEIAEQALDLIEVTYNPLPAVFTAREALEPGAPQLYEQYPGNLLPGGYPPFGPKALSDVVRGDVQAGFAEADIVVSGTSSYENMPNPAPLEPPGVIRALGRAPQTHLLVRLPERGLAPLRDAGEPGLPGHPLHRHPLRGQLRVQELRGHALHVRRGPGQGHQPAGEDLLRQGRAPGRLCGAPRVPDQRPHRHDERRPAHGHPGRMAHEHRGFFGHDPGPGGGGPGRGPAPAELPQLGPDQQAGGHQPATRPAWCAASAARSWKPPWSRW